jgi:DDE_Tnp_1-associated/Transposase DDE domain
MIPQSRPLIDVLAEMPDFRHPRGKRHSLAAILALACSAMLCGSRSSTAIAAWGRHYGEPLVRALGFPRRPPCAATLHTVFRRVDREVLEAKLGTWAEGLLTGRVPPEGTEDAVAIDGKALRGSQKQGAPGAHLLSAFAQRLGITLAPQAVADKTNEIPVVLELLRQVVLEGRVVTMDALRTQRQIAQQILDAGGHSVMVVKDNQPQLLEDIQTVFPLPPMAGEQRTAAETLDSGTAAASSAPYRPVLCSWGTVIGLASPKYFRWSARSLSKRPARSAPRWWPGAQACHQSAPRRDGYWRSCGATGTSRITPIGCGMSPAMQIGHRCAVATSRK